VIDQNWYARFDGKFFSKLFAIYIYMTRVSDIVREKPESIILRGSTTSERNPDLKRKLNYMDLPAAHILGCLFSDKHESKPV
jgi:hypothetical protein